MFATSISHLVILDMRWISKALFDCPSSIVLDGYGYACPSIGHVAVVEPVIDRVPANRTPCAVSLKTDVACGEVIGVISE
jgi:hypothetical protein